MHAGWAVHGVRPRLIPMCSEASSDLGSERASERSTSRYHEYLAEPDTINPTSWSRWASVTAAQFFAESTSSLCAHVVARRTRAMCSITREKCGKSASWLAA